MKLVKGQYAEDRCNYGDAEKSILRATSNAEPLRYLKHCPLYEPTPLHKLDGLAKTLGVASVFVKDESRRLNLMSFKALGGVYAVAHLLLERAKDVLQREVEPQDLLSDEVRAISSEVTFTCATDGNHGRSVAAGARLFGAKAVIFMPEGVTPLREQAIANLDAEVVRTSLNYDEAVAAANEAAADNGWILVADTGSSGYE